MFFPESPNQIVVTDMEWFVGCLNKIIHRQVAAEELNGMHVHAVSPLVHALKLGKCLEADASEQCVSFVSIQEK